MRRTPYDKVRFSRRTLADGKKAIIAVIPCRSCAAWKVNACKECRPATSKEIDAYWGKMSQLMWNLDEDFVVKPKYNEEKGEWEDDWCLPLPFETP
tara:strand:+ start:219 stop:506 length:288 start_codon:yes stop_codon:yes gene_type:complete